MDCKAALRYSGTVEGKSFEIVTSEGLKGAIRIILKRLGDRRRDTMRT